MPEPLLFVVTSRRGAGDALSGVVAAEFGAPLPPPGRIADCGEWRVIWTGRESWFFETAAVAAGSARARLDVLRPGARIVEVGDGYARFVMAGPAARERLQRLAPIDLHPSVFPPDAAARTVLEHIPVLLHAAGPDVIEALAPRSMAEDAARLLDG
ncbi:sarcosine oxidase subunit gamma [Rubrimonas cliftonensis]|uniref:Sarcosine oxidase subunit gamma n=1 Tax=Rubrimonas cliftonensis TaxID=89524 RepID=A0A1H4CEZ7_9RHOB|nr:sarcosine oxidase subunit gamma family protein [Rubrimonas cliftonensis]SEA59005.1 sarcosine oxidase subunit gamma [Rubrimonas cliftonensis]